MMIHDVKNNKGQKETFQARFGLQDFTQDWLCINLVKVRALLKKCKFPDKVYLFDQRFKNCEPFRLPLIFHQKCRVTNFNKV